MNPITCGMAADLLPLYLDGCCSADSCAALEAHMDVCTMCRAQYAQMQRVLVPALHEMGASDRDDDNTAVIAHALSRKMRRRKRWLIACGSLFAVLLVVFLVLVCKTMVIMGAQATTGSAEYPAGVVDLAERAVVCNVGDVSDYVFATSSARVVVTADALPDTSVSVRLWQVRDGRENTMVGTLDAKHKACIFTNLPPQTLYAITVEGAADMQITVRSSLTFWEAFSLVLHGM